MPLENNGLQRYATACARVEGSPILPEQMSLYPNTGALLLQPPPSLPPNAPVSNSRLPIPRSCYFSKGASICHTSRIGIPGVTHSANAMQISFPSNCLFGMITLVTDCQRSNLFLSPPPSPNPTPAAWGGGRICILLLHKSMIIYSMGGGGEKRDLLEGTELGLGSRERENKEVGKKELLCPTQQLTHPKTAFLGERGAQNIPVSLSLLLLWLQELRNNYDKQTSCNECMQTKKKSKPFQSRRSGMLVTGNTSWAPNPEPPQRQGRRAHPHLTELKHQLKQAHFGWWGAAGLHSNARDTASCK